MKRLTWQGAGTTNIITRKVPVRTLEDLNGLQIRTAGKFLQPPLLKAVGAVSVGIPMPGLYDALQKNIVDGSTGSMSLFVGYKLYEVGKYITIIGIGGDPGQGLMMNLDKWNKLPEDVKQVMTDLYENDFPRVAIEQFAEPDFKKSIEIFDKNGVEVMDLPEREIEKWKSLVPLDQHVKPWVEFAAKTSGQPESKVREILNRYNVLIKQYENEYSAVLKDLLY